MRNKNGFALTETLIALAIMATMMAMVFRLIGSNALMTSKVNDRAIAALVARSALDHAVVIGRIGDGPLSGVSAGYRWQAQITPYGERNSFASLRKVTVTVRNPTGAIGARLVTLAAP